MKGSMMDVQDKLYEQILLLTDKDTPYQAKKALAEVSCVVSSLAKQMINNADVILRTEKLVHEGKLSKDAKERIIGSDNNG